MVTSQSEEALLSIRERQSEGEIMSIIRGLGKEIGELSDSDRGAVAVVVRRRLKVIIASIANGICVSSCSKFNTT